jgi:beta-galactosidase
MKSPHIQLRPGSIWINDHPVIIFASSLFYFRIAAEEWRSRMQNLVRLGYNAIDVYFPWNYHELEPGCWDFDGQRDVAVFLQIAKEENLWVIARPGPYICSEWDGGALPAFLNVNPELRLREADPLYLEAVNGWYSQILPIIAGFQIDQGGTVILMQLENELDFYDCKTRTEMMSALRDKAKTAGITVPLIACAGQGDISGATGDVEGIVPTCNVYFDAHDPEVEPRVRQYAHLLHEQGYPLCIVETNRSHTDLRRLVIAGAKLVGPYLQTSGTDFGFTTGITNWGNPLSFMTSHYDFGGMISPGGIIRPEGLEARLLTQMIQTLGPAVALALPADQLPVKVTGSVSAAALALDGGGWLIGLANPTEEARHVHLNEGAQRFPRQVALKIGPNRCPFILLELPLARWGLDGQIVYATAELTGQAPLPDGVELAFVSSGPTEIALRLPEATVVVENVGWQFEQADGFLRLWQLEQQPAVLELRLPEGRLVVRLIDPETAVGFTLAELNPVPAGKPVGSLLAWQMESLDACAEMWFSEARACLADQLQLEQNGIYRGFGWYRSPGLLCEPIGLLVQAGADVLSLYAGDKYLGSLVPAGLNAYLPILPDSAPIAGRPIVIRAEIWGHPNFDDSRLPALQLKSLRGMRGVAAVWEAVNITPNWFYQDQASHPVGAVNSWWPCLAFGGWSTTKDPAPGIYYRSITFDQPGDTRILHFPELQVNARVYLNQTLVGEATPHNPWVDLSSAAESAETVQLAIFVERQLRLTAGPVVLYLGQRIEPWEIAGWGEVELARLATRLPSGGMRMELPFRLEAGKMVWLHTHIPDHVIATAGLNMIFEGSGLKCSVWLGERLVGRVWLPSQLRPRMAGGPANRVHLPAGWMKAADGNIHLLIENTGQYDFGELTKVVLAYEV